MLPQGLPFVRTVSGSREKGEVTQKDVVQIGVDWAKQLQPLPRHR